MNTIGFYIDGSKKLPILPKNLSTWLYLPNLENFKMGLVDFYKTHGEMPKLVSINHDLTDEHISLELRRPAGRKIEYEMFKADTGLHVSKALIEFAIANKIFLNQVVVHGLNMQGNNSIIQMVNDYYKLCGQELSAYQQNWEYEK